MKKHSITKSLSYTAILCILLTILMLPTGLAAASETEGNYQHIYDEAGLLSTNELETLEEMCIQYSEESGAKIIILTHNRKEAVDGEIYIENFYDKMLYGDSVILLVDMYNRDVLIQGYGLAEKSVNSSRIDVIIEKISPHLTDEEYNTAFQYYISKSAAYIKNGPLAKQIITNVYFQIVVSLVIGLIVVGIMVYNSGGKMTAGGNNYIDGNHSGLIGRRDDYIRTTVTRVRKPSQKSGGGGISAGGHSHSSGRGKF